MNLFSNKKTAIFVLSSGLVILIALLFFPNLFASRKPLGSRESAEVTQIKTQSKDTSLDSIKNDLDKTSVDNVDKELDSIEKEIDTSI